MGSNTYEFYVLGIEHISYVNKQGRQVEGNKLYLVNQDREIDVGQSCEDVYININVNISGLKPGDECNLVYNRFGSVVAVDYKSN